MSLSPLLTHTSPVHQGRIGHAALWTVQIALAGMFLLAGSSKLFGAAAMVGLFDAIGIGQWFRYVTGLLEVVGGVLLVIPGKTAFGAVLLACVMAGAVVAHLTVLHTAATVPLVLFALTALIAWGRRSQLTGLLG